MRTLGFDFGCYAMLYDWNMRCFCWQRFVSTATVSEWLVCMWMWIVCCMRLIFTIPELRVAFLVAVCGRAVCDRAVQCSIDLLCVPELVS